MSTAEKSTKLVNNIKSGTESSKDYVSLTDSVREFHKDKLFAGCVTLSPARRNEAWDNLSRDTWQEEVSSLPRLLHNSFIATAKLRKIAG